MSGDWVRWVSFDVRQHRRSSHASIDREGRRGQKVFAVWSRTIESRKHSLQAAATHHLHCHCHHLSGRA